MRVTHRWIATVCLAASSACSADTAELPETTRVEVMSPSAGLIRSADGQFEVEFQLGALSQPTEVTIHTDRARSTSTWPMTENLPRYRVHITPCVAAKPELIRVRHVVPEGLSWDGRLTLARTTATETEVILPTALEDGVVRADGVIDCAAAADGGAGVLFELASIVNRECSLPEGLECAPCAPCEALDTACRQRGDWVCQAGACLAVVEGDGGCDQVLFQGWNEQPASGRVFVVNSLAIAGQGRGFDVDGQCRGPSDCIDNSLWQLGQLGMNSIREGLLGGETLLLIELAGLDEPFVGSDHALTLKVYDGRDADDPFFPANNFSIPTGETTCCEFELKPRSLTGVPPQARSRVPARIQSGQLLSLARMDLQFVLALGGPPHPELRVNQTYISARVPTALDQIADGMMGGMLAINTLAATDNPYCKTLNQLCPRQLPDSTMIDLVASILQPDIDLDGDGLERLDVGANGRVGRCLDGDGSIVPPSSPNAPAWTCTLDPRIADGYSIAFEFTAVPATIVGIAD